MDGLERPSEKMEKKNTNNKYGREDEKSKMTRKSQRKRKRGRAEQSWI
jgi:hypothetical protein